MFADASVGQADRAHGIVFAGLGPQIDAAQVDAAGHPGVKVDLNLILKIHEKLLAAFL